MKKEQAIKWRAAHPVKIVNCTVMLSQGEAQPFPPAVGIAAIFIMLFLYVIIKGIKKHFKIDNLDYKTRCEECWKQLETPSESRKGLCADCQQDMKL